jgi:ABC-type sugar transport system ATPase subunit
MIRIEGLTILFESFRITDLHIEIEEGEFHFLLGPTGSGKTLILESVMGLHKPKTCHRSGGISLTYHRI